MSGEGGERVMGEWRGRGERGEDDGCVGREEMMGEWRGRRRGCVSGEEGGM